MATQNELNQIALNWSPIIQAYTETEHSARLDTVPPKGDLESIETLVTHWEQAIPNTYPAPTEAQLLSALAVVQKIVTDQESVVAIETNAAADFASIPNWADWTPAEAEAWIDANVTDLASAKVALGKMAYAIMVLADKVFPNRR